MSKNQVLNYALIAALALGAIGILGEYDLVVIKGVSNYSFELLLAGFAILAILRLFKR